MVSRGERELRGERRGKGGRSLLATAAPFFFICLLSAQQAAAQRTELYARAGILRSSALVVDQVATTQMSELLGSPVDEEVRAVPGPGLALAAGARIAFWPRVVMGADVEYARAELRAEDGAGTRTIQDIGVVQAVVGPSWAVRSALELGAAVGLLWYRADERGLFAAGSETSPLIGVSAAWTPAVWGSRVALVGAAQTHRFGTPVIRSAGGQDGNITRISLTARIRLLEAGR